MSTRVAVKATDVNLPDWTATSSRAGLFARGVIKRWNTGGWPVGLRGKCWEFFASYIERDRLINRHRRYSCFMSIF